MMKVEKLLKEFVPAPSVCLVSSQQCQLTRCWAGTKAEQAESAGSPTKHSLPFEKFLLAGQSGQEAKPQTTQGLGCSSPRLHPWGRVPAAGQEGKHHSQQHQAFFGGAAGLVSPT